jgi:cytochrome c oxidase subunit II
MTAKPIAAMSIAFTLLTGCGAPTPQTAFNPRSDYAAEGLDLFQVIIVMGVVIGVLVEGVLIWAAIRYRRRGNDQLPPQIHGNTIVEIAWTTAPVIVVGYILFLTLPVIFETQAPAPSSSMNVEVIGHQFWWEFQYPDANVDTANELHLPVGRTVNLILHSNDVIHSFWIPALGGKRDAIPGHTNFIWLTPNSTGEFPGQCYQLCGYSHANMRERAISKRIFALAGNVSETPDWSVPGSLTAGLAFVVSALPRLVRSEPPTGELVASPRNPHREYTESFYVLTGEIEFRVGERTARVAPGVFIHVAAGCGAWLPQSRPRPSEDAHHGVSSCWPWHRRGYVRPDIGHRRPPSLSRSAQSSRSTTLSESSRTRTQPGPTQPDCIPHTSRAQPAE